MRLHDKKLKPGHWWACMEPERPYEFPKTWFDSGCRGCIICAIAASRHGHGPDVGLGVSLGTLDEFISRHASKHGLEQFCG